MVQLGLAMVMFACSEYERDNPLDPKVNNSIGDGGGSSSSGLSSSGLSSSSVATSSSDAETSSSSEAQFLCTGLVSPAYTTRPVNKPDLVCPNGETASDIDWQGAPNWGNPTFGRYDISVTATCGTETVEVDCGTLYVTFLPKLTCTMPSKKAYAGVPISEPSLSCDSGEPSNSAFTDAPSWSSPVKGDYAVSATVSCGTATDITAPCGTLSVINKTLACELQPTHGLFAITKPALICDDGSKATDVTFSSEPELAWDAPEAGTYDVSVQANCGAGLISNDCGTLEVASSCGDFDEQVTHFEKPKYQFCDERGERPYVYVEIGTQTWMAEDLEGEYNWSQAMTACPVGWHLPSREEWSTLIKICNTSCLKAEGDYWSDYEGSFKGTDDYGFSAIPTSGNNITTWWSSEDFWDTALTIELGSYMNNIGEYPKPKSHEYHVRCVRD
jgi:hypothetical protein